jgi:hypothetical protein
MKRQCIIMLLAACGVGQTARSQSVAPAPQKPGSVQQSDSDEEAVRQADRAVRRAAATDQPQAQVQDGQRFYTPPVYNAPNYTPPVYPPAQRMVKAAYLGLSTSPPPAALRHQLRLPDGTALVVDFVQPNSPAQKAGIRQYDLLLKLNDQLLINAEQLAVLVRTFKPGDEIHLTLLREGERQSPSLTLAERELPPLSDLDIPSQFEVPLRPGRAMGGATGGGGGEGGAAPNSPHTFVSPNEHTLTWLDGKRQITVSIDGDHRTVTVADAKSGKIMFQGPLEAVEQQNELSPDTRDALSRLKQFLQPYSDKKDGAPDPTEKPR